MHGLSLARPDHTEARGLGSLNYGQRILRPVRSAAKQPRAGGGVAHQRVVTHLVLGSIRLREDGRKLSSPSPLSGAMSFLFINH